MVRIYAGALRSIECHFSPSLRPTMLKYVQVFMVQTAHTAVANSVAKRNQRLARGLLMAHDRVVGVEAQA
jgi:hypothetical protein